jgi:hypothetical protein
MSLKLPLVLVELARLVRKVAGRYSLGNVKLQETLEGFRAEATDGRRLAVVTGPGVEADVIPILLGAPNGASEALVPAEDWKKAFRLSKDKPIHCVMGPTVTTFASGGQTLRATNGDGHWPNIDEVLPKTPPVCEIIIDAHLFADLIDVAGAFSPLDHKIPNGSVTLRYWSPDQPMLLATNNGSEFFTGLIMPCTGTPAPARRGEEVASAEPVKAEVVAEPDDVSPCLDMERFKDQLAYGVEHYRTSNPMVSEHLDALFVRITEEPDKVTLCELLSVSTLWESDGGWMDGNFAANRIYKTRERLGMDVTGWAGF